MTRRHRIFTDQRLEPGNRVLLQDGPAHHLTRVLRVARGQSIVVFNGDGSDYSAEVSRIGRGTVELYLRSCEPACAESPLTITLVQAVGRGERMDWSLQKATELGVSAVQPVFTEWTEVRIPAERLERRMQHWRQVTVSACEQSGRARLPRLFEPSDVLEWASQESTATRIMLIPGAKPLAGIKPGPAVELLIGPEGGLSDHEVAFMQRQGILAAGLGPRILRTETAGPAAIAVLQAVAGDMRA